MGVWGCSGYSITGGPGKLAPSSLQSSTFNPEELKSLRLFYLSPVVVAPNIASHIQGEVDFTNLVREVLTGDCGLQLLVLDSKLSTSGFGGGSAVRREGELQTARRLGADALFAVDVLQFTTRRGSKLAADRAAAVHMIMKLMRVVDGRELWRGSYFYKDQAWSENLFKMAAPLSKSRRLGWLAADEIFKEGVFAACRDFYLHHQP